MGFLQSLRIEMTKQDLSTLIRTLNERLSSIRREVNANFNYGYLQVTQVIETAGTWTIWIPASDFEIESWILRASGTTTNPQCILRVDGSAVDTQTLSDTNVHEYEITDPEPVSRLQQVQVSTSNMTASEVITSSIVVRRTADVV